MKRAINIFALFFIFSTVKATDTLTTKLINSIYLQVVDSNAKYYYLAEMGRNPKLDTSDLKYDLSELTNYQSLQREIPYKDFTEAIKGDTAKINWSGYDLVKAKCVDRKHMPRYEYGIRIYHYMPYNTPDSVMIKAYSPDELFLIYVSYDTPDSTIKRLYKENIIPLPVKKGMSKKKRKAIEEKAIERYEDRPIEEKNSYYFSKPVFSKDHKYALIELQHNDSGAFYIFKFSDGKWTKLFAYGRWVY